MIVDKNLITRILSSIILLPLYLYIVFKGSILFNLFLILVLIISIFEWSKFRIKNLYKFIGFIFLLISFYCFYLIRNSNQNYAIFNFLLISLICIGSDIGGISFGKFFKGPKITKISPNKTFSGVFGAYFFSILFSIILYLHYNKALPNINNFFFIIFISTVSQIGDLIISYFKRLSKLKDTGQIIPGHGGILDRIDGMIFAFPASYILYIFI